MTNKKPNPCNPCINSLPINELKGCFHEGDYYYHVLSGKQRVCNFVDCPRQKALTGKQL